MTNTKNAPAIDKLDHASQKTISAIVTPKIAEGYLAASANLRPVPQKSVRKILTDIRGGNFMFTGNPIKFAPDGKLIDGAAVLSAIIRANTPVKVAIATGISYAARNAMDSGAQFKLKDALVNNGITRANAVQAALNGIQEYENGEFEQEKDPFRPAITIPASLDFLAKNPSVKQIASDAENLSRKLGFLSTKQVATLLWIFAPVSTEDSAEFFKKLHKGYSDGEGDPVFVLREQLIVNKDAMSKLPNRTVLAITVKAFNLYRSGETVKKNLTFVGGGTRAESFPKAK
ncbi:hypothetical protein [Leifsonia sp. Leaf264]|uniref:hypothetical protein n=1 Tax=Leifsonia sp. Leaf264 TaxID=1736314 RepID=UPI0006F3DE2A|nr:hypothetical protein [Leifsonia sp. Leaf264]KQO98817.1 hypothetical protein ASF30_12200 [Leifsonia sp. Leaf264]